MRQLLSCIVIGCFTTLATAAPWEGPRKTEDELRKIETNTGSNYKPSDYRALSIFQLHIAYSDLFDEKKNEVMAALPTAGSAPPDPGLYGVMAAQGVHSGVGSHTNDKLFALAVGVDVLSWLTRDRTQERIAAAMKTAVEAINQPALWLVKIDQETPSDSDAAAFDRKIRHEFLSAQTMLLSFPLKCDQTYYRATNPFGIRGTWGQYIEGLFQSRFFLCGHDSLDITFNEAKRDLVNAVVTRSKEGKIISRVLFEKLAQNEGLTQHLEIADDNKKEIARKLAEVIRPNVPLTWKIVYTAPNKDGDWKVFVASNGIEAEFNLPETRR